jgi:bifunctional non-homologous end joining protein LigD
MLATSGALPEDYERWAFEPKWDGFRAIVHIGGRAVVWSRRGTDLTDRFPEVAGLASAVPPDTVLDGELVVFDASGRPDFEAIRRPPRRKSLCATKTHPAPSDADFFNLFLVYRSMIKYD